MVRNQNGGGYTVRRDVRVVRVWTSAHSEKRSASRIDRRRVVTTDEFRMVSANGKQQMAGLNCTAKFPRAATRIRYLSRPLLSSFHVSLFPSLSLSHNTPFPFSPFLLSRPHDGAARGGCCGVACVCKSCVHEGVALQRRVNMHVCDTQRLHAYTYGKRCIERGFGPVSAFVADRLHADSSIVFIGNYFFMELYVIRCDVSVSESVTKRSV